MVHIFLWDRLLFRLLYNHKSLDRYHIWWFCLMLQYSWKSMDLSSSGDLWNVPPNVQKIYLYLIWIGITIISNLIQIIETIILSFYIVTVSHFCCSIEEIFCRTCMGTASFIRKLLFNISCTNTKILTTRRHLYITEGSFNICFLAHSISFIIDEFIAWAMS